MGRVWLKRENCSECCSYVPSSADKGSDEKPHDTSFLPGSNPVYGVPEHLPVTQTDTATSTYTPHIEVDNPIYAVGVGSEVTAPSADQPPQHESGGSLSPATGPLAPPTSTAPHKYDYASLPPEEGELYDAPDVAPRPRPQQPQLTYDYAEPPAGTVGSPTAMYDAPLLPPTVSHDYDYASAAHSAPNDLPPEAAGHYEFGH